MKRVSAQNPATLKTPIRASERHFLKKDPITRQSEQSQSNAPQLVCKALSLLAFLDVAGKFQKRNAIVLVIAATEAGEAPMQEAHSLRFALELV